MTDEQYNAIIKALKKPPTQEQIDRILAFQKGYDEYMALEVHEGNCHCSRCMAEFYEKMNVHNKENGL